MKKIFLLIATMFVIMMSLVSCEEHKARKEREAFIADSLAKRRAFIQDSLIRRTAFIQDSLEKRATFVQDSLEAVRIEAVKHSIAITSCYLSKADYCGGRSVYFHFKNISKKTIKYLTWEGSFYNAVGDLVSCEIRDYCTMRGTVTGPIKPNGTNWDSYYWGCAIYNYTARRIEITNIEIEYMDGTSLNIRGNEIQYLIKQGNKVVAQAEAEAKAAQEKAEAEAKAAQEKAKRDLLLSQERAKKRADSLARRAIFVKDSLHKNNIVEYINRYY